MPRRELTGLVASGIAALALLAGCGQHGPLTLPEVPAPDTAQAEDEAQDDEREEDAQD